MSDPMLPHERLPYSPIVERPPLKLPGGARVAVWTVVNLEVWDVARAMPRTVLTPPMGQPQLPDVPNWAWHEYGMRVGVWRFFELFRALGIKPTAAINGMVCERYPQIIAAGKADGWEFIPHGYEQRPMQTVADQPAAIRKALDTIEAATGTRPIGWLAPGMSQTLETPDFLAAEGLKYTGDYVHDDEPSRIITAHGEMVTVPYTFDMNDITIMALAHHEGQHFYERGVDQFTQLDKESRTRAKIMPIPIHAYLSGQPHRFVHLEKLYRYLANQPGVVFMTGAEIHDWYVGKGAEPVVTAKPARAAAPSVSERRARRAARAARLRPDRGGRSPRR
jgi:peptidoglycan/xylan/chitin deacetylase (PgdA/CDA1 family)